MNVFISAVISLISVVPLFAGELSSNLERASSDPSVSAPGMSRPVPVSDEPELPPNVRPLGLGISHSGDPYDIPDFSHKEIAELLKSAGGSYYRPHIPLKEAMPVIDREHYDRLVAAQKDESALDSFIDYLAEKGKWERIDAMVDAFTAGGVNLIAVVGCGYQKEAPSFQTKDGKLVKISPARLGNDLYLTLTKAYVGAAARRYGDRVKVWQVENEINISLNHAIGNWRVKDPAWLNRSYQMRMLKELSETVRRQGRRGGFELRTTQNFSTSMPGWEKYIKDSAQYLDIIGIDMYGNYLAGWPRSDKSMADNVLKARAVSGGKPVWVLEVGFADGPKERFFSPQAQAAFFKSVIERSFRNGAEVVLVFGWFWNPAGWYTDSGKPAKWYDFMAAEPHWSPLDRDPVTKEIHFGPAWDVFRDAAKKWLR